MQFYIAKAIFSFFRSTTVFFNFFFFFFFGGGGGGGGGGAQIISIYTENRELKYPRMHYKFEKIALFHCMNFR